MHKGEFIDLAALSRERGFNTIKDPRKYDYHSSMMALRSLKKVVAHTKRSRNGRIVMADGRCKEQNAQRSRHASIPIQMLYLSK